jgi:hypothetical protein
MLVAVLSLPAMTRRRSLRSSCECRPELDRQDRAVRQRAGENGEDEDHALGDRRIVGRDVEDEQDVDDDHQDVGAEHGADRTALSAAQPRAADDDCREQA